MWLPFDPGGVHGRLLLGPVALVYAGAWWWAVGNAIARITPAAC